MGLVSRPGLRSSFGASAAWSVESGAAQYVFDLGLRPLGRDWLTVFADWTVEDDDAFFKGGGWGAGLEVRPVPGLQVGARLAEPRGGGDPTITAVVGLGFHGTGLAALPAYDGDGEHRHTAYLLRTDAPFEGRPDSKPLLGRKGRRYYALDLQHKVITYQKYRYFDDRRVAWLDLVKVLDVVRDSPNLDGVAVNLAGTAGRPSLMWELREKFAELRAAGKEVIVHGDRFDPVAFYAAAGADVVSIDPWGLVGLPGFTLSRSYLKGTLAKLGIGFQEFRYLTYKSAAETFSRDSMSEPDREQRQRIVDVLYEAIIGGVAAERGVDASALDRLVDEQALLQPEEARAAGLVDVIGRWDQLGEWLRTNRGGKLVHALPEGTTRTYWDDQWGDPAVIPVVYAVGACAMDSGIKGRTLAAYLNGLVRDRRVKAVVLRADSPGGDVLPSDLVADAVRRLKAAGKPVIVSQGDVAASGGYWISMDGTEILTTPVTITGSIGVIGGWIWDDGIAGKVGVTSDAVSRGRHADLGSTVNLPFLGGIPRRAMTDDELARTKTVILENYDRFVAAVAQGRGLAPEAVGAVAQGRVWMGGDAIEHGLCDRFGTLQDAITAAREAAGVPDWREVALVEYPPRPLFELPSLMPRVPELFGLGSRVNAWMLTHWGQEAGSLDPGLRPFAPGLGDRDLEYLQQLAEGAGRPLAELPPDLLPEGWQTTD